MTTRTIYAVVVLLAFTTCQLHADLTVKEYRAAFTEGSDPTKKAVEVYIAGVARGISYANTFLKSEGRPPLYCQPPHLAVNPTNHTEMLDRAIKEDSKTALQKSIDINSLYV